MYIPQQLGVEEKARDLVANSLYAGLDWRVRPLILMFLKYQKARLDPASI
jgi:hypothetical protein